MEIIAGIAGGIRLEAPRGLDVRPTAVRARKSLFDSLGSFAGLAVADLFAGSGSLGLEAASRGAAEAVFIDDSPASLSCVGANCAKITRAGVKCNFNVVKGRLPEAVGRALHMPKPDIVFADPPYAESAELLAGLLADKSFLSWANAALLVWEMPDFGLALEGLPAPWRIKTMRQFGPARFLLLNQTS